MSVSDVTSDRIIIDGMNESIDKMNESIDGMNEPIDKMNECIVTIY